MSDPSFMQPELLNEKSGIESESLDADIGGVAIDITLHAASADRNLRLGGSDHGCFEDGDNWHYEEDIKVKVLRMVQSWLLPHWCLPFNGIDTPLSGLVQEILVIHNSEDEESCAHGNNLNDLLQCG